MSNKSSLSNVHYMVLMATAACLVLVVRFGLFGSCRLAARLPVINVYLIRSFRYAGGRGVRCKMEPGALLLIESIVCIHWDSHRLRSTVFSVGVRANVVINMRRTCSNGPKEVELMDVSI